MMRGGRQKTEEDAIDRTRLAVGGICNLSTRASCRILHTLCDHLGCLSLLLLSDRTYPLHSSPSLICMVHCLTYSSVLDLETVYLPKRLVQRPYTQIRDCVETTEQAEEIPS